MTEPAALLDRVEIKYLLSPLQEEQMAAWLDHCCAPDPKYPTGTVSSVYFDTPRLACYQGKASSDFIKVKVRLRWYGESAADAGFAFLESKIKQGRAVRKAREKLALSRADFLCPDAGASLVENLQARAEVLAGIPLGLLSPVCLVRYRRRRYVDARTGSRVALDGQIRVFPAAGLPLPAAVPVPVLLGVAVLEVKGSGAGGGHFPHLFPGTAFTSLPSSFSKYGAGIEALVQGGLCGPARP